MSSSKVTKTSVHTIDEKHTEIINEINHNHETVIPELLKEKSRLKDYIRSLKKSQIDAGKGFKRIYFVIATIWVGLMFFFYLADFMACEVHKNKTLIKILTQYLNRKLLQSLSYRKP